MYLIARIKQDERAYLKVDFQWNNSFFVLRVKTFLHWLVLKGIEVYSVSVLLYQSRSRFCRNRCQIKKILYYKGKEVFLYLNLISWWTSLNRTLSRIWGEGKNFLQNKMYSGWWRNSNWKILPNKLPKKSMSF